MQPDQQPTTAADIPYEGTDCTPEEAVEAVKAVRATAAYEAALDRVGDYLANCSDPDDLGEYVVGTCPQHPLTVGDLWTLYRAHREGTHRV